jgi:hypothetical protein
MASRTPTVEFLWWDGCPSSDEALAMLREEMSAHGLDPDSIAMREVRTDTEADRERFAGSPTIRVDGRDVQPPPDGEVGLSCRVYRLRDGRISPLPDRAAVRETLEQAIDGGEN